MTTRPVVFPGGRFLIAGNLIAVLVVSVWVVQALGTNPLLILAALSLLFGVLFVLPVGGADVPIVISLLNAFTGLTVAASGCSRFHTSHHRGNSRWCIRNYLDSPYG